MTIYIFSFFIAVLVLGLSSQFIHITKFQDKPYFKNFISSVVVLSGIISFFAAYFTNFKTIFIAYLIIILFYFFKKEISFKKIKKSELKPILLLLSFSLPIFLFQYFLNYSFNQNEPYIPSDDIFIYASYSKHLIEFGQENKFAMFSQIYPKLFSGINPYHFYEIWLNGFVTKINNLSYSYNFIFVTYPLLVWIFVIGITALFEHFNLIGIKNITAIFGLLFVGPLYFSIYGHIFNDGNILNSAVFTIPGFVKQTLCFSYFGQKHLPVYIFSLLFLLLFINKLYKTSIISLHGIITASFGMFPGIYTGIVGMLLPNFKKNLKFALQFFSISFILFFGLIQLFPLGVSKEISDKTFYFNYFLTDLNWKGEIIRALEKIFLPAFWLLILYLPVIIILLLNINVIKKESQLKKLLILIVFTYIGGASFTLIVDGLNTDQFLTNLLPLYNTISVFFYLYFYHFTLNKKDIKRKVIIVTFILITIVQNTFFCVKYFQNFRQTINGKYEITIQQKLIQELQKTKPKYIAYLLSDKTIKKNHPMHQCIYYPAKFLFANNYYNFLNINYPYQIYLKNSTSHVYAPYNQMRYFINNKPIPIEKFESIQLTFLQKNNIEWILCEKNAILPSILQKRVKIELFDPKSGEKYYRIRLK
jgi:hypothetical protein